jgi:ectoine hydroxylase-related dioxygenase (phytanoyl-CoA dioxygenase family)
MNYRDLYLEQGYLTALDILDRETAAVHRAALERAEAKAGTMHYLNKIHTVLRSPAELVSHPAVLDVVEQLIGPDILVYNSTYIIKEANTPSHVSWHQDLTYWGLDSDDQVSLWLALSEASVASGCMRVIPGSQRTGKLDHIAGEEDEHNVLFQNQRVADIDEAQALACPLGPGQASLHHGWLLHASATNQTSDRRIGLNVQYIAPHVRQKLPDYSAWLVRGEDRYRYYAEEKPASTDLDPVACQHRERLEAMYRASATNQ